MRTVATPDKGVEQADEHVFPHAFFEAAVGRQCSAPNPTQPKRRSVAEEGGRTQEGERRRNLKVSFLIFSRTSQGPRATYSRNVRAGRSFTRSRIFHIRGLSVGSCA